MIMNADNRTPDPSILAGSVFCKLAKEWNSLVSEADKDVAMPRQADEIALSCVLLAVERGEAVKPAQDIVEANIGLALGRWGVMTYANSDALPWKLCKLVGKSAVPYLVQLLSHHQSAIRDWAMRIAWLARPWLDRGEVVPLLLKNVADTLGGVRTAMGLASGLCANDQELEEYIGKSNFEGFQQQFLQRIEQFRSEGFSLSKQILLEMELCCRKRIEQALLGIYPVPLMASPGPLQAKLYPEPQPQMPNKPSISYLKGDDWILSVSIHSQSSDGEYSSPYAPREIPASNSTVDKWNEAFTSLIPTTEPELLDQVHRGVWISLMFPFNPTIQMQEYYGRYHYKKLGRIADNWRYKNEPPPPELDALIKDYAKDAAVLDFQYESAWKELLARRLPQLPRGYHWRNDTGGLVCPDRFTFRIWHNTLGYMRGSE